MKKSINLGLPLFLLSVAFVIGCGHKPPTTVVIDNSPVITEPPVVVTEPPIAVEPPAVIVPVDTPPVVTGNIGDLTPEAPLNTADAAIVNSVITGSKELDNRRNRVLLAGCNYPGSDAQLTFCVFDVKVRHLLGFAKKFKIDPADMRLVLDRDYTKANLVRHIDWIFDDIKAGDLRVICLSSHGAQDTMPDGTTAGVVVTADMVYNGEWSAATEIQIDYWKAKCKSVPNGSTVVMIFDLCYSGGDIKAAFGNPGHNLKKFRSIDGPPAVQARVAASTKRALLRDVNAYNVVWLPTCLDSELSSEGSRTGGAGSWAIWSSIDKNTVDGLATVICRDGNAFLRADQDSQHLIVLGRNNKQPLFKAAP